MGRPVTLVVGIVALAAAACVPGTTEPTSSIPIATGVPSNCAAGSGLDALLVPECGVLLGTTDASESAAVPTSLDHQEQTVTALGTTTTDASGDGFTFALVRVYQRGSRGAVASLRARLDEIATVPGRILYFSWKVATGTDAWAAVAAGDYDDTLVEFAETVAASGRTIFLSLHHEPEGDPEGLHEDYVSMWRHAYDVIEGALDATDGGGDIVWVMNYMGHVDGENIGAVDAYYPGNEYVDWISYNPYNWAECHRGARWRSFIDVATPMYRYLTLEPQFLDDDGRPKPLMIGETATNEDPDDSERKAEWLRDMAEVLEGGKLPQIKAVVYFNHGPPQFCERYWDSSEASAHAFVQIATSPFFNPQAAATGAG